MQCLGFQSCRQLLLCLFVALNTNQADSGSGNDPLPALAWLREHSNFSAWYDPSPPAKLLDGRLTREMCEKRILPDSFVYDQVDWYTYGEKRGTWLQRYSGMNQNPICWGEGASANEWFDSMLAADNCNRPWMVMSEEDVPKSSFQQYTQEAPAVMGLDPVILEFCRNLTHDSRPVPHVNDPFWRTWKAAGMPAPERSLGPMSTLESNLLQACSAANRNILRVSAMAQAKTSWDMCANVEWVVCAAKGKLPNQGKTIEFSVPPGNVDGNLAPTYREYRSNIMRWSAHYEIDIMAETFYMNEICFLSELCDNADELWTLKRGEPFVCKHSEEGDDRLKHSLINAYDGVSRDVARTRKLNGGHVGGGHIGGGHVGGGHIGGGHVGGLTTTTTTQNTLAPAMTKVVGAMEVEINVQGNIIQEVLEATIKKGIAEALDVSIENVVKLTVSEIVQNSGLRRLQPTQSKKYLVSYEVVPPSSTDPDTLVEKANRITQANTAESQVFQQVLVAQDGVSQVLQVVPKIAAYKESLTTTLPTESEEQDSGISAGIVILIISLILLCLMGVGGVLGWRMAAARSGNKAGPNAGRAQGTLLSGTGMEAGKKHEAAYGV